MPLSTIERVLFLKGAELFNQIAGEDLVPVALVAQEVHFRVFPPFDADLRAGGICNDEILWGHRCNAVGRESRIIRICKSDKVASRVVEDS